jgi:hypothetical protein
MSDPIQLATTAAASTGGTLFLRELIVWFMRRNVAPTVAEGIENTAATKLDQVLEKLAKMESALAVLVSRLDGHSGEVDELKERLDAHDLRISRLDELTVELKTRIEICTAPKRAR